MIAHFYQNVILKNPKAIFVLLIIFASNANSSSVSEIEISSGVGSKECLEVLENGNMINIIELTVLDDNYLFLFLSKYKVYFYLLLLYNHPQLCLHF